MTPERRGGVANIRKIWAKSLDWERQDGHAYYDRQRHAIAAIGFKYDVPVAAAVAVFAVLSPNNDEAGTYRAAEQCFKIKAGQIPWESPVQGYPANKAKALRILGGEPILDVLSGPKVTAFYWNTINPDNNEYITVDGHMLGVWCGRQFLLRGVRTKNDTPNPRGLPSAEIATWEYPLIANDFRSAARLTGMSAPRYQAILWLAWKRIHKIRWQPPQLVLPFADYAFPLSNGSQT